jgi:hypothetical protein
MGSSSERLEQEFRDLIADKYAHHLRQLEVLKVFRDLIADKYAHHLRQLEVLKVVLKERGWVQLLFKFVYDDIDFAFKALFK